MDFASLFPEAMKNIYAIADTKTYISFIQTHTKGTELEAPMDLGLINDVPITEDVIWGKLELWLA